MMTRIPVLLDEKTASVLVALAKREYRDPRQQAAVIIRDELTRRGLLDARAVKALATPADVQPEEIQPT